MGLAITGQGLAGCCLAWQLHLAGADFSVYDEPRPGAASRVAAGMINPVTGKNYTTGWRLVEALEEAVTFYRQIETITGRTFWYPQPVVRLVTAREWPKVEAKLSDPSLAPWISSVSEDAGPWRATITLKGGGRVATRDFCETTMAVMREAGRFRAPGPGDQVIHCEGAAGLAAGQCGSHRSAKGEILTLRAPWAEDRILVGGGGWLVPIGNGLFKAGATYVWDCLDSNPTPEGLATVKALVTALAGEDFEVTGHEAGVRPILRRSQPVAGRTAAGLIVFNGLGSKGSLHAPSASRELAGWLLHGTPVDPEMDAAFFR